ncbi:MAG: hypothetical protein Q9165_000862 [Trypethelium subeluteriae]
MLRLTPVAAALCLCISYGRHHAQAQVVQYNETTLASVVFIRTGDHTPFFLGTDTTRLTSSGAQQLYNAGTFFRSRYISSTGNTNASSLQDAAPIPGLEAEALDNEQLFFLASENNVMLVTAEAFAQGLYPPSPLSANGSSALLDPSSITANNTFTSSPVSNYQYVAIGSTNDDDPTSIIPTGNNNCPAWQSAFNSYSSSAAFTEQTNTSQGLYLTVGSEVLNGVLDPSEWDYSNAYAIYDYVAYQVNHNHTIAAWANSTSYNGENILVQLRALASQQLWELNSPNAAAQFQNANNPSSIFSISGATVAMSVLDIFQQTISTQGGGAQRLSVFVADVEPFLGFASVSQLASRTPAFQGLPGYGAAMVWELYSVQNSADGGDDDGSSSSSSSSSAFPSTDDLWVRFLFRNGSDQLDSGDQQLLEYPLFGRDPDQTEMKWTDFEELMGGVAVASPYDWCTRCDAQTLFCIGINALASNGTAAGSRLSNAVAGVIGAAVTIGVILVLALIAFALGGLRLHTVRSPLIACICGRKRGASRTSTGQPRSKAPDSGALPPQDNKHESLQSAVTAVDGPHDESDRVRIIGRSKGESWEMTSVRRQSLDEDDKDKVDEMGEPVEARESV